MQKVKKKKVVKIKNGKMMLLSKCAVCNSKQSRFIKEQKTTGLLSSLAIKIPFNKILVVGPYMF